MNDSSYRIFCIWSGNNEMSPSRKNSIEALKRESGCRIELITPENIQDFNQSDFPIHENYEKLSLTHRSDYLRAYLAYHYGGGYSDIKPFSFNWVPIFDSLYQSEYQFTGSRESCVAHIASNDDTIRNSYNSLVTMQRFIFKPKTEFALEWLSKVNAKLSDKSDELKKRDGSYHPKAVKGGVHGIVNFDCSQHNSAYPFGWNEILGMIFHDLCFKNIGKFSYEIPQQYFSEGSYR